MHTLSIVQIVLSLLAIALIFDSLRKFVQKQHAQTFLKFIVSISIWTGILFSTLFPATVHKFSRSIGLGENLNTLIFIVFVVIFMILYKLIALLERAERNISEIVRHEALSKLKDYTINDLS